MRGLPAAIRLHDHLKMLGQMVSKGLKNYLRAHNSLVRAGAPGDQKYHQGHSIALCQGLMIWLGTWFEARES